MNFFVKFCVILLTFLVFTAYSEDPTTTVKPGTTAKPGKPDKPSKPGGSGNSGSSGNSEKADLKKNRYTEGCECEKKEEPVCSTRDQTYANMCILKCRGGKPKHLGKCTLQAS